MTSNNLPGSGTKGLTPSLCVEWIQKVQLLYVDDMLIACKSKVEIVKVKEMLKGEFEMKDMRLPNKF